MCILVWIFQQTQGYGGYDQSQYSQQAQGSNGAAQNTSYGGQQSYDQSAYGQQSQAGGYGQQGETY